MLHGFWFSLSGVRCPHGGLQSWFVVSDTTNPLPDLCPPPQSTALVLQTSKIGRLLGSFHQGLGFRVLCVCISHRTVAQCDVCSTSIVRSDTCINHAPCCMYVFSTGPACRIQKKCTEFPDLTRQTGCWAKALKSRRFFGP